MKAILTVGVSASGKSTWASEFIAQEAAKGIVWTHIERDMIRKKILVEKGFSKELEWDKWNPKWEEDVTNFANALIDTAALYRSNIVISDTNLNPKYRNALKKKLRDLGYHVELKMFPISFEEAVKRDVQRNNGVGVSVLVKQFEQWNRLPNRLKQKFHND